jgi:hypothetical protein
MIENAQHRGIGAAKAILPPLRGRRRNTIVDVPQHWLSSLVSSEDLNASPAHVASFTADLGLTATGVAAAIASAAFAVVMISQNSDPPMLKGARYPKTLERAFRTWPRQAQRHIVNHDGQPSDHETVDYNVTGSISKSREQTAETTAPQSNSDWGASSANSNYVLRFVHKQAALLQRNRDFYVVRQGTILPSAGKVLSITRLGNKWILVTATRIFTENRE